MSFEERGVWVAYGQLWIHPADALPHPIGRSSACHVLWPCEDDVSIVLLTGRFSNEITLSIELLGAKPSGPVDEAWEVAEEMSLAAAHPLHLTHPGGDASHEPAVTPPWTGPARVRAHVAGREPLGDGPTDERHWLQIWPEPEIRPSELLRDREPRTSEENRGSATELDARRGQHLM